MHSGQRAQPSRQSPLGWGWGHSSRSQGVGPVLRAAWREAERERLALEECVGGKKTLGREQDDLVCLRLTSARARPNGHT